MPFFQAMRYPADNQTFYPTVVNVTATGFSTATTAHAVAYPASVTAGNLLLMVWTNDDVTAVTTPTNYTLLYSTTSLARSSVFVKIAAGTEGGTTINVQTAVTEPASAHVYNISNWSGSLTNVVAATPATGGSGLTRAAPSLTPAFGACDALWIVTAHASDVSTIASLPPGFTNMVQTLGLAGTGGGQTTSGEALLNAATVNPGNFTLDFTAAGSWTTGTMAVKGRY